MIIEGQDFWDKVRETVEYGTEKPAYLADDEEWAIAVDIVWKEAMYKSPIGSTCPHCGEPAPYGNARIPWLDWHIDSHIHKWWWKTKRKLSWWTQFPKP